MVVKNLELRTSGVLCRTGRLKAEYYEHVEDPCEFINALNQQRAPMDLFSFLERVAHPEPRYNYYFEPEKIAVVTIASYDEWWKKQISDKTRNMIRKAAKAGVQLRTVEFNDELVRGIGRIYNETYLRQGKPFAHYGKDFEWLKAAHITYPERSQFIGAYFNEELIGFIKLVHGDGVSNIMQILSMTAHRDKAPTNALIAKAMEICAERKIPRLHYGVWTRRGLGEFKKRHAFEPYEVTRYFVPLTWRGRVALRTGMQKRVSERLPESWVDFLNGLRTRWYSMRYQ